MKGKFDFLSSLHHLKMSYDFMQSFSRDNPQSVGARMMRPYIAKIEWIANDLITNTRFPLDVRQAMKAEWNADSFVIPAIDEKIAQLTPQQREALEQVIDCILNGEKITVVDERVL